MPVLIQNILPPSRPRWSWWDVVIVLVALFGMVPIARAARTVVRQAVLSAGVTEAGLQSTLLFVSTVIQASVMILGVIILVRRKGAAFRELGLVWDDSAAKILTGLAGGMVLAFVVIILGSLLEKLAGPIPPQEVENVLRSFKKGNHFILAFISISVLAPVSEELYFRGMTYPVIRARFGPAAGMILSALFFGALHLDIYRLVPLSLGGMALAWFYEKTGSLLTSIVAHSTWNTLMLVMFFAVV